MHDHTTRSKHPHRRMFGSVHHMVGALGDFWSSDLNRAAIDMVDPQPGMTLLDVGAGLGPATISAARRIGHHGRVVAVDPSPAMRRSLRVRSLWQGTRRRIDVRDGTAENLPVATSSVDAAWAVNAAHHFDDLERAAAELARVLKPGGRLLLIEEDLTNPKHAFYQHSSLTDRPEPVDAAYIAELLTATALSVTYTEHQPIAGVAATIISATAPTGSPATEMDRRHTHPGEPS